jgi:outer membrane protein assembly factor BamD (BamD/ComL family)
VKPQHGMSITRWYTSLRAVLVALPDVRGILNSYHSTYVSKSSVQLYECYRNMEASPRSEDKSDADVNGNDHSYFDEQKGLPISTM